MIPATLAASKPAASDFETFLTTAMQGGLRHTRGYALDHGVDESALVQYVNGAVCDEERHYVESIIARNEWSRTYVVDLVKSRRKNRVAA